MQRERVAEDIYVFTSELYARVTAGAVVTPAGAILIDTLPYPHETQEIKEFLEIRLQAPVRFVINTHYHADHTYGTCFFPNAVTVGHALCRQHLDTTGRSALEEAQSQVAELEDIYIVLPEIVFDDGCLNLHLGGKSVNLVHSPGHSDDSVTVYVPDDRVLFAADTMMPVPFWPDGNIGDLINSLQMIVEMQVENVVQGHGEVILRGEIQSIVESDIRYLTAVQKRVARAIEKGMKLEDLPSIDIESCGKSRIPLNGLVVDLHEANLRRLYREMLGGKAS
jgi:cyclase